MNKHLKLVIEDMREDLLTYLPKRIVERIEPDDVIKMHDHKVGNDLIKPAYKIDTNTYIDLMCHYDTLSKIIYR